MGVFSHFSMIFESVFHGHWAPRNHVIWNFKLMRENIQPKIPRISTNMKLHNTVKFLHNRIFSIESSRSCGCPQCFSSDLISDEKFVKK